MKSIGSMIVLLMIGSLANVGWSGAQSLSADSNLVAASKAPVLTEVEVRFVELSQEDLDRECLGTARWMQSAVSAQGDYAIGQERGN